jgi:hypothetical protein
MEVVIYSDYPQEPIPARPRGRPRTVTPLVGGDDSAQKETSGAFGYEVGEIVKVTVSEQRPRNPRMLFCTLMAPDGMAHKVLVRVGKSANFRPGMRLEIRIPPAGQEREPWNYDGVLPKHRGRWGTPGPRGVRQGV